MSNIETQFNVYTSNTVISILPAGPDFEDGTVQIKNIVIVMS
jgi:hypothetical protein